ncbi:MAG: FtsH protease activity modulator HflK [Chloroflexi bacterium]|nr:FtsH protease activity modulator HflK [Chloroflexota bacterium]|tara:strand:- start:1118 stop:2233 length:1116 start_codon:yes stop_codon:yes gene_type:complete
MNFIKRTLEISKVYRPPSGSRKDEYDISFQEFFENIKKNIPFISKLPAGNSSIIALIIIVIAVIWLGTGVYTVGPDQQAALRMFGKFQSIQTSGLHWWWPSPIGQRDVVVTTATRQLELGFRSFGNEGTKDVPDESLMITGDENIVDVQAVIQYRISNLKNYLFLVDDPGEPDRQIPNGAPDGVTLRDITETALRQVVGRRNIDDVLTTQKGEVQDNVLIIMRDINEYYKTGIEIIAVRLQNVNPPLAVQDAFDDVTRAREERDRIINLADAYKEAEIPKALGEAAKITEAAQAFKQGRIAKATGEAEGFKKLLEGYNNSPEVTRQRLYLEMIERVFPSLNKYIINDSKILPLLDIDANTTQIQTSSTSGP